MPSKVDEGLRFNTIEESIEAFGNGEFIIVLDSQNRENEGDLIIAADSMTASKMAFMIRWTSGYICCPIPASLCTHLNLPQMVLENADPNGTAYTISIDATDPSVTTGISAHDRALTCRTLARPDVQATHFRRPGHILPLQAKSGGVLERPGHTEAAVEFCRLVGKPEAAVICELVEDGEEVEGVAAMEGNGMMRAERCLEFGKRWGVKVCTIEDLRKYLIRVQGLEGKVVVNGKH
ncbi:3,4-dihydroxy-2-butanone 4-phosphate synthase [Histoplasma capsulatum G186AR]|uniref:3,4-dihydroxy-2-butanone 4-phosphate synthase n=2 Tax=Ajellomyces capsulatus TaxID=5037 RepID=C0NHB9_AJECG|nr:3,4-dihydroxy-2-butanone 4-phosphate synthase [Histoplasma capsulatum G186AR]EEH09204.1 3,4-dihydroxy-2-butanone 4-phosphate synthase [Histoplasma capsulatum G186AR]KAG5303459.1 3,4-dihydroxy-2-butanone 4-phosphate synthase [Histoplasma capsulatum]QSS69056.1 3,4-dihydroxy-2-butanone 4-phosphate synthase [Histoplasma capsulatum G186AR]